MADDIRCKCESISPGRTVLPCRSICRVRGPAIIGAGTIIEDAYVGPFTSIYLGCTIRKAEIENSIVLERSVIENVDGKIDASLIGKECVVHSCLDRPRAYKLMLGDQSQVELR